MKMSTKPYHHVDRSIAGNLKGYIQEQFNDLGNILTGKYWQIKNQQENITLYYAYALLAQRAYHEGNIELADLIFDKQAEMCFMPNVNDPNYRGSRQEWLDLNDAQYKAKEIARSFVATNPINGRVFNDEWMNEDHLDYIYWMTDREEECYEQKVGIALYPT